MTNLADSPLIYSQPSAAPLEDAAVDMFSLPADRIVCTVHGATKTRRARAYHPLGRPPGSSYEFSPIGQAPLNNTLVMLYVPRRSAVYAGIIRMMSKYRRCCSSTTTCAREKMTPGEEDDYDEVEVQGRVEAAAERIRGWGRAGEWREGEQWMEDALIGLVKGDKDMERKLALNLSSATAITRWRKSWGAHADVKDALSMVSAAGTSPRPSGAGALSEMDETHLSSEAVSGSLKIDIHDDMRLTNERVK
ncbi:hypothetical protein BD626DRAFT_599389 [Schizophyllum amplum]|uniref:Uncharacterized protein n=1 Tax=Schizophyllum amplum TaxID=97359 RepID=A0A550C9I7_9AGAR|nr:hypothetical protein BD626DRAFT_599389 [Auriculariopsis ampla]